MILKIVQTLDFLDDLDNVKFLTNALLLKGNGLGLLWLVLLGAIEAAAEEAPAEGISCAVNFHLGTGGVLKACRGLFFLLLGRVLDFWRIFFVMICLYWAVVVLKNSHLLRKLRVSSNSNGCNDQEDIHDPSNRGNPIKDILNNSHMIDLSLCQGEFNRGI